MALDSIRVFIADDHPMVRAGLSAMLDAEDDLEKVGEAADGAEALRLIPATTPDVVLMDLILPQTDGIAVTAQLKASLPEAKFVILTSVLEPHEIERAIAAGAAGYVLKNASAHDLVSVIRSVHAGRRVLDPAVTDALIAARQSQAPVDELTSRESEILGWMTQGLNNQDIATRLHIALPTVKFHVTNILSKLQVDNRTEAVLKALKLKLVRVA